LQAKYSTVLRLLKQWRTMKQLGSTIYPEVIDSVLLMLLHKLAKKNEDFFLNNSISLVVVRVLEELAQVELYDAVAVQKDVPESEIFNYFANVSVCF
jgi:glutamate/tyrosine decarboxylase-like PLP-dependent enzyme